MSAALLVTLAIGVAIGTFKWPPYTWLRTIYRLTQPDEAPAPNQWPYVDQTEVADTDDPELERHLDALGYLDSYSVAAEESGVTLHSPRAAPGLNLIVSGHEAGATLMDMEGRVLHSWSCPATHLWRDADPEQITAQRYWRRVELLPDGGLIAISDYDSMIRLDRDSNVVWQIQGQYHHEVRRAPDGTFLTLERRPRDEPDILRGESFFDDLLVKIDRDGNRLQEVSITDALLNSHLSPIFRTQMKGNEDLLHTNTVHLLDGHGVDRNPAFAAGNVLISLRELNTIAVIDPDQGLVVWALAGLWQAQHDPVLLKNGRLLIFDNQGLDAYSRVIEIDSVSQKIHWTYEGNSQNGFFSECCGTNQRLLNGNTLIVDTAHGRAFEVTNEQELVWRWVSPYRKGNLVAALFEVVRVPPGSTPWLRGTADIPSGGQCPDDPQ